MPEEIDTARSAPTQFEEQVVSINGFDIRDWMAGDGDPLVMLHGGAET